jgi:hypothetical protein
MLYTTRPVRAAVIYYCEPEINPCASIPGYSKNYGYILYPEAADKPENA